MHYVRHDCKDENRICHVRFRVLYQHAYRRKNTQHIYDIFMYIVDIL